MKKAFPAAERLRKKDRISDIFTLGERTKGEYLDFFRINSGLSYSRLAISISKKIVPLSTQRNLLRRIIRETYRTHKSPDRSYCDLVIRVKKAPRSVTERMRIREEISVYQGHPNE